MKLKCQPEDFRVEEILRLRLKPRGAYSIYRLEKRFWNTLDVIRQVQFRYRLKGFSRAGLKDRYSRSIQYLSLPGKGPELIAAPNYQLTFIGMADEPVTPALLIGNRFRITVRSLKEEELDAAGRSLPLIKKFGVANYYDEQRFGSARHQAGFIARKLIAGHYNGALKLFLATPSADDDSRTRRIKEQLAMNWGQWQKCREIVPIEGKEAISHLVKRPKDFEGAVRLLPKTLLELFINAYQSWLWNETLRLLLEELGRADLRVRYRLGEMVFYEKLTAAEARYLFRLVIPVPGPRAVFKSEKISRIVQRVLAKEGLELKSLKLKFRVKGLYFKPWDRPAVFKPQKLAIEEPQPDELYPGKRKLTISFVLPPGAYATVLVKRLFGQ
ncbi:MAG: tRNA pseudouridine(13) synthase TruD [bacterium]